MCFSISKQHDCANNDINAIKINLSESNDNYFYSITSTKENGNTYLYIVGYEISSTDNTKAIITKWNVDGTLVWQRKIEESNDNYFYSITSTKENGTIFLYAIGCRRTLTDNYEAFITKWNVDGTLIWRHIISKKYNICFESITSVNENGTTILYVIGSENSSRENIWEPFIIKLNVDGSLVQHYKINMSNIDRFTSITSTKENGNTYLYIVGYEISSTDNTKAIITKWNVDGTLVWKHKINESINNKVFYSITSTNENETVFLYAVGYEASSTTRNSAEALITKWNVDGTLIWQRKIGKNTWNYFISIASANEDKDLYAIKYEIFSKGNTNAFITKWTTNKL